MESLGDDAETSSGQGNLTVNLREKNTWARFTFRGFTSVMWWSLGSVPAQKDARFRNDTFDKHLRGSREREVKVRKDNPAEAGNFAEVGIRPEWCPGKNQQVVSNEKC